MKQARRETGPVRGLSRRNTIQQELVLYAVRRMANHPTPEQVYDFIAATHPSVSKSTVYRNLDKLCESGELKRIPVTRGAFHVDHTLTEHHHLCCESCGGVFDVFTEQIGDLTSHIVGTNGCLVRDCYIVFNGLCPECNK